MRLAVESAAIGIFEIDFLNRSEECNAVERVMFGFKPDEKIAFSDLVARVHEADRAARLAAMEMALNPDGDGVYETRFRIRRANDGALRWIATSGKAFFRRREMTYLIGVSRDVTDDVNAERLLHEKTGLVEQLTSIASTLPGALFTYRLREDGSGYLPYAAPKITDVIGIHARIAGEANVGRARMRPQRRHEFRPGKHCRRGEADRALAHDLPLSPSRKGVDLDRGRGGAPSPREWRGYLAWLFAGCHPASERRRRAGGERRTPACDIRRSRRRHFHR